VSLIGQEKIKTIGTDDDQQHDNRHKGDHKQLGRRVQATGLRIVAASKHREKSTVKRLLQFVHKFFLSTLKFYTEAVDISVYILLRTLLNAVNTPPGNNRVFFTQREKS